MFIKSHHPNNNKTNKKKEPNPLMKLSIKINTILAVTSEELGNVIRVMLETETTECLLLCLYIVTHTIEVFTTSYAY